MRLALTVLLLLTLLAVFASQSSGKEVRKDERKQPPAKVGASRAYRYKKAKKPGRTTVYRGRGVIPPSSPLLKKKSTRKHPSLKRQNKRFSKEYSKTADILETNKKSKARRRKILIRRKSKKIQTKPETIVDSGRKMRVINKGRTKDKSEWKPAFLRKEDKIRTLPAWRPLQASNRRKGEAALPCWHPPVDGLVYEPGCDDAKSKPTKAERWEKIIRDRQPKDVNRFGSGRTNEQQRRNPTQMIKDEPEASETFGHPFVHPTVSDLKELLPCLHAPVPGLEYQPGCKNKH